MEEEVKRLFFGLEVQAPWPPEFPEGRLLPETSRHLTLAFLGDIPFAPLEEHLSEVPALPFRVGMAGRFDRCLFLPPRRPRVVSWHIQWFQDGAILSSYQKTLAEWLRDHNYNLDDRDLLPHVTIARGPFAENPWRHSFTDLPLVAPAFHLYESMGNLTYQPLWSRPLIPPVQEVEHTADIAFLVRGESLLQLQSNAQVALAFKFPLIMQYFTHPEPDSLDDVIIALNSLITQADRDHGCPFKAVSFCGEVEEKDGILQWEMIVDV